MNKSCKQVEVPKINLEVDPCNGTRLLTNCMIVDIDFPELDIQRGATVTEVLKKIIVENKRLSLDNTFYKNKIDEIYREINL